MNDRDDMVLRAGGVRHTYHTDGIQTSVLHGLDLELRRGEFLAVMGPSGCGKTTLLHILGLMMHATDGSVEIDGQRVDDLSDGRRTAVRRDKLGFVFQRLNLLPVLTAVQNVALALRLRREPVDGQALAALDRVGLTHRRHNRPNALSAGEQQRVAIARALVCRPTLLLADEPTGNLDSQNAEAVLDLLVDLNGTNGLTIVMITHDERLARRADRVLFMRDGRFV